MKPTGVKLPHLGKLGAGSKNDSDHAPLKIIYNP